MGALPHRCHRGRRRHRGPIFLHHLGGHVRGRWVKPLPDQAARLGAIFSSNLAADSLELRCRHHLEALSVVRCRELRRARPLWLRAAHRQRQDGEHGARGGLLHSRRGTYRLLLPGVLRQSLQKASPDLPHGGASGLRRREYSHGARRGLPLPISRAASHPGPVFIGIYALGVQLSHRGGAVDHGLCSDRLANRLDPLAGDGFDIPDMRASRDTLSRTL
mmetsp:Transcript_4312/g.11642  ORF Transcript_4312/g.11642 Transcript_4312/m.11642 type:complete len:219 (+) Transcript_4312:615-1271(+)